MNPTVTTVIAMILAILLAMASLAAVTAIRRQKRMKYFQRLDGLRASYGPLIAGVLAGNADYAEVRDALKEISGTDQTRVVEQLLLENKPTPEQVPVLRNLCEELGLVKVWQRQLAGQRNAEPLPGAPVPSNGVVERVAPLSFLVQAASAHNLGIIRHQPSWPLLQKALNAAHPDVRSAAARSLAAIGEPDIFPALLDRLYSIVLDSSSHLSLRSVKAALIRFPLSRAGDLTSSLQHSNGRIRFLAVDIIREMAERESAADEHFVLDRKTFSPQLTEVFLADLWVDANADVRARAAPVIGLMADPRATPALIILLEDTQWYVRLHAVRALAKPKHMPFAELVTARLTDTHWRVREAAARTLLVFEHTGIKRLIEQFLTTHDRYTKEQIADEMQRAGLIPILLNQYANAVDDTAAGVLKQMANLGKTSCLVTALRDSSDCDLHNKFLLDFGQHPDPQISSYVKNLASGEPPWEFRPAKRGPASAALGIEGR